MTVAACFRDRFSSQWREKKKVGQSLARNLKAEIDEELIESYRGTESLPFEAAGEYKRALQ